MNTTGFWLLGYGIVAAVVFAARVEKGRRSFPADLRSWPVFARYVFANRSRRWWARSTWVALARPLSSTAFFVAVVVMLAAYGLLWLADAMVKPWDR